MIEEGEGDESLAAAAMVFGSRALRKGDAIGIGGMIGINSALKSTQRQPMISDCIYSPGQKAISDVSTTESSQEPPKYIWRQFCADGSQYGIYPESFETADDYEEALKRAKGVAQPEPELSNSSFNRELSEDSKMNSKYIWRKYCTDGSPYGIDPQDFETADDYEEMIQQIRERKN